MTKSVFELLDLRYADPGWAYFREMRSHIGYGGTMRSADAVAMSLWPSRGLEIHGHEVKTDRNDLLRELKDPAKAEAIQKHCDRWWLVLSDKDLIKPGELPPTWGLLAPNGNVLRAIKAAPKLKPKALDREFVAVIMRRMTAAMISKDTHDELRASIEAKAKERADELIKTHEARNNRQHEIDRLQRAIDSRDQAIQQFEARTGVKIGTCGFRDAEHAAHVAYLANHLLSNGADLDRLATSLEGAAALARAAASVVPERRDIEQATKHRAEAPLSEMVEYQPEVPMLPEGD